MKLIRGALLGAVLWVLIFFEVSILMFGFKLSAPSPVYYTIHALLLTIFVIVLAFVYFKDKKVKRGVGQGIVLGIVFIIVEVVLDSVITIPLFMNSDYSFLLSREIVLGDIWALVLCAVIGGMKNTRK